MNVLDLARQVIEECASDEGDEQTGVAQPIALGIALAALKMERALERIAAESCGACGLERLLPLMCEHDTAEHTLFDLRHSTEEGS